jgi:hypothetical protein
MSTSTFYFSDFYNTVMRLKEELMKVTDFATAYSIRSIYRTDRIG